MDRPARGSRSSSRETNPALADVDEQAENAISLLERAHGVSWYEEEGSSVDLALAALCRLRRAGAGAGGTSTSGDIAVREVLGQVDPATAIWIASRAVSYVDEHGFPESLAGG